MLQVWAIDSGKLLLNLALKSRGGQVFFSPDGKSLAVAGKNVGANQDGNITLYSTATWRPYFSLDTPTSVRAFAFSPDSKYIAVGADRTNKHNAVVLLDTHTMKEHKPFVSQTVTGPPGTVKFSTDGKKLLAGSFSVPGKVRGGFVTAWDAATAKEEFTIQINPTTTSKRVSIQQLCISPNTNLVAVSHENRFVSVIDSKAKKLLQKNDGIPAYLGAAPFLDDRTIVTSKGILIYLRDVLACRGRGRFYVDRPIVYLALSPDRKLLAACDQQGTIRIWAVADLLKLAPPPPIPKNRPKIFPDLPKRKGMDDLCIGKFCTGRRRD